MNTLTRSAGGNAGRKVHRLATATAMSLLLGSFVLLSGCAAEPGYDQYAGTYTYAYPAYGFFGFDDFDDFHRHHDRFDHHHFDHDRFDHDGFDHHHFDHGPGDGHHWDHAHPGPGMWPLEGAGGHRR